ncbi:MAG: GldG family protein [Oscillospiraceae bacterium]|nr:GldG family protein [Oscillospiraceae bacterium]
MAKKNRKQNPLEAAGDAKKNALDAAKEAENKANAAAEAAEDAADKLTEDIGDAAEEAEELLEETAEELAEDAEETAEEAADAIREAEKALKEGVQLPEAEKSEDSDAVKEKKDKKKREYTPEQLADRAVGKSRRRKKFKFGTLAVVITAVVLGIVVLVNVICHVLDDRFHWNIDLTSTGKYELDQQTIDYLHKLNKDIQIGVMVEEGALEKDSRGFNIIVETLDRFKKESDGHIDVEYIDMTKQPEAVNRYSKDYDGDFVQGDAVVKCGELTRVVPWSDLINTEQIPNYQTMTYDYNYTFVGEQSLLSAVAGVTDLNPVNVALISKTNGQPIYFNYDTPSFNAIKSLLEKNNYVVTELDLASDELSAEKYDMAILCAPYNDPTSAQIDKLENYLKNDGKFGKDLVYFSSCYQQETPELDAFLTLWGLKFNYSLLYETDENSAQIVPTALGIMRGTPTAKKSANDLNANATESKLPLVAPYARPIELEFVTPNNGRETQSLLDTHATTIELPLDEGMDTVDPDTAEKKAFTVAAVATNSNVVDNQNVDRRIIAFGSPMILDANILESKSYQNAGYFISVLNTASGKDAMVTIAEKSLSSAKLTITENQMKWIRYIIVIFIPLLVAAIGVVVYVRRKNR